MRSSSVRDAAARCTGRNTPFWGMESGCAQTAFRREEQAVFLSRLCGGFPEVPIITGRMRMGCSPSHSFGGALKSALRPENGGLERPAAGGDVGVRWSEKRRGAYLAERNSA